MARGECIERERKKKSWEDSNKQRFFSFSLAESLPEKKRSPSFSCWALLLSQKGAPPSGLSTLFNWDFCLLFLYTFPFWPRFFSESIANQESSFIVSVVVVVVVFNPFSVSEMVMHVSDVSLWRENMQTRNLLKTHSSKGGVGERFLRYFLNLNSICY